MDIKKYKGLITIVTMFIAFSIIGWIWELLYDFLKHGFIANHGVLHGPWLPIYGFGGIIIYLLLNRFRKHSLIVFMGSFVFCTIIEYCTGWFLETYRFNKWWNYKYMPFNLDGRICLLASIFFGISGLACIYIFTPRIKDFIEKHDLKKVAIICLVFVSIIAIDWGYSTKYPNIVKKYKVIDASKVNEIKLFKN